MARPAPHNKGRGERLNICPDCGVEFRSPMVRMPDGRYGRQCPDGHWNSIHALGKKRTAEDAERAAKSMAGMRFRRLGVSANVVDSLSLGILAMIGAYERVRDQFPAGSQARALLDGAFEHPAKVARELVR